MTSCTVHSRIVPINWTFVNVPELVTTTTSIMLLFSFLLIFLPLFCFLHPLLTTTRNRKVECVGLVKKDFPFFFFFFSELLFFYFGLVVGRYLFFILTFAQLEIARLAGPAPLFLLSLHVKIVHMCVCTVAGCSDSPSLSLSFTVYTHTHTSMAIS